MAVILAIVLVFLALTVLTDGRARGWLAWGITATLSLGVAALLAARDRKRQARHVLVQTGVAAALTASVCVPSVPTTWQYPPDLPGIATQHWTLSTGSRVAVYHYPPPPGVTPHPVPLLYLHGGPIRGIALIDHTFLRQLAERGFDVYAYEEAGGGRSDPIPMPDYSIDRSVRDFSAVLAHIPGGQADVLGFSAGAVVLTRALAAPSHIHRAVIAEPGPMDGPTAQLTGSPGHPTAAGIAPPPSGPHSITKPRYAVALGLVRSGVLSTQERMVGQAEVVNAFTPADLGSDTAASYCAKDADRIPVEDSDTNFSFNPLASLQVQDTIAHSPAITPPLGHSTVPAMLMIAECSHQLRQWETAVLAADPAITRTQYMTGVGHHIWNGLDDDNDRAATVITAFLDDQPAPLPNYPTATDIPAFLRDHR
ncbi:alpha/beta fold hydrolase [Amycolatopsis pigmentata]|uniref:Alpha/beta fold hydrolase n=1 Tax=Amycolatopsis pigmentata TaxID=450801 RepID=A0ABW5FZ00_9PSEU